MKRLLIHPTHRKFIRLLRKRAASGNPIIITRQDADDFRKLMKKSRQRLYRHQGIYRITLRAMNRPESLIETNEIHSILDNKVIDHIAEFLCTVERRQLGTTLISAFIVPLLRKSIKVINKYGYKK